MYVVETDRKKEEGIDRIMISENLRKYATEKFERRRELLAPVMPVIEEKLKQCSEEEADEVSVWYDAGKGCGRIWI